MAADIRTAAQREAERAYNDGADDMSDCCPDVQYGFERGAEWAVNRVTPTREQVAEAIHNALPDSLNGGCYRWPAKCIERGGSCVALADAALMAGLAEGES